MREPQLNTSPSPDEVNVRTRSLNTCRCGATERSADAGPGVLGMPACPIGRRVLRANGANENRTGTVTVHVPVTRSGRLWLCEGGRGNGELVDGGADTPTCGMPVRERDLRLALTGEGPQSSGTTHAGNRR